MNKLDWTHKNVKMTDIRKPGDLYLFTINHLDVKDVPLKVSENVFEKRLSPYFLKSWAEVTRGELLGVEWNMYITQGFYIKLSGTEIIEHPKDDDGWYVSFLEIAGPLGSFQSVLKNK